MVGHDAIIYENAHAYRLHQDNLRWSLFGGYAAFFVTSEGYLLGDRILQHPPIYTGISILLLLMGTGFLLGLAIENWYYNLFAAFVRDCDDRVMNGQRLRSLGEFHKAEGPNTTPIHSSFMFALMFVSFGNGWFIASPFFTTIPPLMVSVPKLALASVFVLAHFFVWWSLFRKWDDLVYRPIILRFQQLFARPGHALR
jgi:hypothetical protein